MVSRCARAFSAEVKKGTVRLAQRARRFTSDRAAGRGTRTPLKRTLLALQRIAGSQIFQRLILLSRGWKRPKSGSAWGRASDFKCISKIDAELVRGTRISLTLRLYLEISRKGEIHAVRVNFLLTKKDLLRDRNRSLLSLAELS